MLAEGELGLTGGPGVAAVLRVRRTTSRGGTPLLTLDCGAWLLKKMHSDCEAGVPPTWRNRTMMLFSVDEHVKHNQKFLCAGGR